MDRARVANELVKIAKELVGAGMTAAKAKKLLKAELDKRGLPYTKLTAKNVGFSDLARDECVFVTVHGWQPNPAASELEKLAKRDGYRITFKGKGIIGKSLTASFSGDSDKWVDMIVDEVGAGEAPATLVRLIKGKPTKANLEKVKAELAKAKGYWVRPVQDFIKKMEAETYKSEFKKFDGVHSQVSELFSLLRQALTYNN